MLSMALTAVGTVFIVAGFVPLRRAGYSDHDERFCAWCYALMAWLVGAEMIGAAYFLIGR